MQFKGFKLPVNIVNPIKEINPLKGKANTKKGTVLIGGKEIYFRSGWEANIAAYYEWLKVKKEIKDWFYEPKTFWFLAIKRGVRSYKPDFLIIENNGKEYFDEVKGYMDSKSATKIKRMKKYYPEIDLRVLDKARYNEIKKLKQIIPNWGLLD
jgi:hypothetical protein